MNYIEKLEKVKTLKELLELREELRILEAAFDDLEKIDEWSNANYYLRIVEKRIEIITNNGGRIDQIPDNNERHDRETNLPNLPILESDIEGEKEI